MHKSFTPVNLVDKSAILVEKLIKSAWITLAIVQNSPVALTRLKGAESQRGIDKRNAVYSV